MEIKIFAMNINCFAPGKRKSDAQYPAMMPAGLMMCHNRRFETFMLPLPETAGVIFSTRPGRIAQAVIKILICRRKQMFNL